MVDKPEPPRITSAEQMAINTVVAMQVRALRHRGREAAVVIVGRAEYDVIEPYLIEERLKGLLVKIDGDVGVRVG